MMLHQITAFLVVASALSLILIAEAKNHHHGRHHKNTKCDTVFEGCKRQGDTCLCDKYTGCKNPFDFETLKACQASMYTDPCEGHHSCYNGGWCLQKIDGGYACKCSGTGYYGDHCEKVCPQTSSKDDLRKQVPKADYENAKACIY